MMKIQIGLIVLIALSAGAAIFVSVLIAKRQDLPAAARRAFLFSNLALIGCLATAVGGISILNSSRDFGLGLLGLAVVFLVIKFVLVRKFAHLIRQSRATSLRKRMEQRG
ncbi:MAG TPA: hypothetical protein VN745_09330 [Verrucomicrobiae bacterium]|nr:hypothetical protein [Verrucomicrobiae bacterium]